MLNTEDNNNIVIFKIAQNSCLEIIVKDSFTVYNCFSKYLVFHDLAISPCLQKQRELLSTQLNTEFPGCVTFELTVVRKDYFQIS